MSLVYRTLLSEYKYEGKNLRIKRLGVIYAVSIEELISSAQITESCAGKPQAIWKTGDIQALQVDTEFYGKLSVCKHVWLPLQKGLDIGGTADLPLSVVKGLDWKEEDFPEDEKEPERTVFLLFIPAR